MEPNMNDNEKEIDLKKLISIFIDKWKIIVTITILSTILVLILSLIYNVIKSPMPLYQATTNIKVITTEDKISQRQAFVELTRSQLVMEKVIEKLKLSDAPKELISRLTVKQEGSNIISITALNQDAERAKNIANTVRQEAISFSTNAMNMVSATIEEGVVVSEQPIFKKSPVNFFLNTIIGGILGLMAAIYVIFLQFSLNDRIQTNEDVEKYLGQRVLAVIPLTENKKNLKNGRSSK